MPTPQKKVRGRTSSIGNDLPLVVIAVPSHIESLDHSLMMSDKIATACAATGIRFIYKSSFDKANRSSHNTARGVGIEKVLERLASVKDRFGCPILTAVPEIGIESCRESV